MCAGSAPRRCGRRRCGGEGVGVAQAGEEVGGGLGEVARGRQVEAGVRACGPKPSQTSPGSGAVGVEAQRRARGVVRGELAGGGDAGAGGRGDRRGRARRRSPRRAGRRGGAAPARRPRSRRWSNSRPTGQGPPSSTAAMRPPRPSSTCARVVGLTRPEGLADGAASGPPKAASRRLRERVRGHPQRDGRQAGGRASSESRAPGRRGSTSVSGPGQKRVGERARLGR